MATIKFSGLASGLDTDNIIKELMKAEKLKVDKVKKQKTKLQWKKDVWKEMNTKLYSFYTKQVFRLKSKSTFMKKNAVSSNEFLMTAKAGMDVVEGTHTVNVTKLAQGSFLTGEEITKDKSGADLEITDATKVSDLVDFGSTDVKTIKITTNGDDPTNPDDLVTISIGKDDTVAEMMQKLNSATEDVNIALDKNFNRIMMSSKEQGKGIKIQLDGSDADLVKALGLEGKVGNAGQNLEFEYNGTKLESTKNEVTVNGLTLSVKGTGITSITVNQDTQGMYESVKDFVTEYNKLLVEINGKLNADTAKGYEPLTDDEKKAMSEDDIKLWEKKIKGSLLRRDSILNDLKESMRSIVVSSTGVDTAITEYDYLSDLGIVTGSYTEKGILHIDGDEDDHLYAANDNKLKEAIEKDPEKVAELLNSIGNELYTTMQKKMKSTKISSALTFYNDKSMDTQIEDYTDRITVLEKKLIATEERYYKQFTAMEKAIQSLNSQSASLASMLGGGAS